MNGILQQIARSNPALNQIKQMMGMVRTAQNPQAMINQMMMNNPQMKQVMGIVQQYGGDSMKALEETAKQYGMTSEDVLGMLR